MFRKKARVCPRAIACEYGLRVWSTAFTRVRLVFWRLKAVLRTPLTKLMAHMRLSWSLPYMSSSLNSRTKLGANLAASSTAEIPTAK
jgi:predicted dithiol-disulfide oxidoreductase (DUF899 family)